MGVRDGVRVSGIPRITARNAEKEKLSTDVTEISAEAKHMLKDFSTSEISVMSDSGDLRLVNIDFVKRASE